MKSLALFPASNLLEDGSVRDLARVLFQSRKWHQSQQIEAALHPAVRDALMIERPHDWHLLVLEWPHVSTKDSSRLAFTRTERDGMEDRQTVTSIGKYLTRHWSGRIADHRIRSISARYTGTGFEIWHGMEAMFRAVQEGPTSCMQMSDYDIRRLGNHPYAVYSESFGWHIAVRTDNGKIVSRALLNDSEPFGKQFVRTYKMADGGGYSQRDEEMEEWLITKGYKHVYGWGGLKVSKIEAPRGGWVMPYLDGECQMVDDMGGYFCITDSGDYDCENADGIAGERGRECECCGGYADEDDGFYVGYNEDMWVGSCCADDYVYAYGRNGNQYYVPCDDASYYSGDYYVDEYLSVNNMVRLECGDIAPMDDCCYCPIDDEWYLCEDCEWVEDREEYVHRDNAWRCAGSDKWYSDDEEYIEVDGDKYHPDHAPETDEEEA